MIEPIADEYRAAIRRARRAEDSRRATRRATQHDIESAVTSLRVFGYTVRATDDITERGKYTIEWPGGRGEKLSARDVWFLARGMRIARNTAQADGLNEGSKA